MGKFVVEATMSPDGSTARDPDGVQGDRVTHLHHRVRPAGGSRP
jgi:hypothetical protein